MISIEQKYQFLLSNLVVKDIDIFEQDALLVLYKPLYFQFDKEVPETMDLVVEAACKAAAFDYELALQSITK